MSTNTTTLKTLLQAQAALLTSDIDKYRCLEAIDQYIAALDAQSVSASSDVQSYSWAGRSVTRFGNDSYASVVKRFEREVFTLLYGTVTLADWRRIIDNASVDDATFES
jgi:hypothetical protein